ncbi:MAG: TMEM175 family protein [Pyrinomonadaceae bacterium]|nr:TMEM175 family protein [Pyrinomonadaceae bacterium]
MTKTRMETFSDGVIAIIITIMVLELRAPHDSNPAALMPLIPVFLSYVLSFIYLGIYWNNHHHLLHAVEHVGGGVLWANLNLLFWLSLIPFATAWMGENHFAPWTLAFYGIVLLFAGIAYTILVLALISLHGRDSVLATAMGKDFKGKISIVIYLVAIPLALLKWWLSGALYILVAIMWLIPDRRIEKTLTHS